MRMLPQFLVIGGMKCGSTSLDYYLKGHPQLFLPEKEVDFFSCHFDKGLPWYETLFRVAGNENKVLGETSVSYTKYPLHKDVPERIHATLPKDVKLIYVVRDPIDRILSHYMHSIYADGESRPIEQLFEETNFDNLYIEFSLYHKQLERYFKYFDLHQMEIIPSDELLNINHRISTLWNIFKFLGVSGEFASPRFTEVKYQTKKKGKKTKLAKTIATLPFYGKIKNNSPEFIRDIYIKYFTKNISPPVLSERFKERLAEILKPDADRLRKISGKDFPLWKV